MRGWRLTVQQKSAKDSKTPQPAPRQPPTPQEMNTLKLKKAWEVALAPVKGLPMTAIMMYMSGNSLQIFSIMMVFMAFKNPLVGLVNTNQAFERFEAEAISGQMLQVKLVYVVCQLVALAVGVWKINAMGLLPYVPPHALFLYPSSSSCTDPDRTTRSDWLMWEAARQPVEYAITSL